LKGDSKPEVRQVAMVDAMGRVAAHTGEKCIPSAGHTTGDGFSCQGNIMKNDRVWVAMSNKFKSMADLPLPERMVAALEAGEQAGGDLRGRQSAAILVVQPNLKSAAWEGKIIDLRVEDNPEPLVELKRLLRYQRGYRWADRGDDLMSSNRPREAIEAYSTGMELVPEVIEMKYWAAICLLSAGQDKERGMKMLKEVCSRDKNWIQVTRGLVKTGSPPLDPSLLSQISE